MALMRSFPFRDRHRRQQHKSWHKLPVIQACGSYAVQRESIASVNEAGMAMVLHWYGVISCD